MVVVVVVVVVLVVLVIFVVVDVVVVVVLVVVVVEETPIFLLPFLKAYTEIFSLKVIERKMQTLFGFLSSFFFSPLNLPLWNLSPVILLMKNTVPSSHTCSTNTDPP